MSPTNSENDFTPRESGRGVNRRQMIKAAGIAGAAVWTAPMIVDSLASPAAAVTVTPGCFRIHYTVATASCSASPSTAATGCGTTGTTCGTPAGSNPSDVLACLSQTTPNPCGTTSTDAATTVTFAVGAGCACTVAAAAGRRTSAIGAECNVTTAIAADKKSVAFTGNGLFPNLAEWDSFEIWLSCT